MLRRTLILLFALSLWSTPGSAQAPLVVAIKEAPPFVLKAAGGTWSVPALDLQQHAAGVLDAVESGEVDMAFGALSVTTARERSFAFTHPFHTTGFSIATRELESSGLASILTKLISTQFLTAAGGLLLILLLVGLIVFLLERRQNPEQFGGNWLQGLGSGLWWSAVTMTTVG